MTAPTPKTPNAVLVAREKARAKAVQNMAGDTPATAHAVHVTEEPNNPFALLARAQAMPEEITAPTNFISTEQLQEFAHFFITSATHDVGKDFDVKGLTRPTIRVTVLLETEDGYSEWVWTPPSTNKQGIRFSDRWGIVKWFERNPGGVLGPLKLEEVATQSGQSYPRLVNTEMPAF
jgi:hypothetical protein